MKTPLHSDIGSVPRLERCFDDIIETYSNVERVIESADAEQQAQLTSARQRLHEARDRTSVAYQKLRNQLASGGNDARGLISDFDRRFTEAASELREAVHALLTALAGTAEPATISYR